MTDGHLMVQFLANAYFKPATGLNILRETIMGRELFDFAFKQYALRWKFKHPTPVDFFRTMEDASAVDLDWFWRGWFYGTDHVDISIEDVIVFREGEGSPEAELPEEIAVQRNRKEIESVVEQDPSMRDFYDSYGEDAESKEEEAEDHSGMNYVQINFKNVGGMIMPLIIQFSFSDGSSEIRRIPAEIWSRNNLETSKVFPFEKEISSVELDPFLETADCDLFNNNWPRKSTPGRFELYKYRMR